MRPNMRQGFLKGSFHLFGGRFRSNLGGHVVQMFPQVPGVPAVLVFKGSRDDMGKVALGRHTGGARLGFQRGGSLLRQVNRQVRGLLLQVNLVASVREAGQGCPRLLLGDRVYITTPPMPPGTPFILSSVFPLPLPSRRRLRHQPHEHLAEPRHVHVHLNFHLR